MDANNQQSMENSYQNHQNSISSKNSAKYHAEKKKSPDKGATSPLGVNETNQSGTETPTVDGNTSNTSRPSSDDEVHLSNGQKPTTDNHISDTSKSSDGKGTDQSNTEQPTMDDGSSNALGPSTEDFADHSNTEQSTKDDGSSNVPGISTEFDKDNPTMNDDTSNSSYSSADDGGEQSNTETPPLYNVSGTDIQSTSTPMTQSSDMLKDKSRESNEKQFDENTNEKSKVKNISDVDRSEKDDRLSKDDSDVADDNNYDNNEVHNVRDEDDDKNTDPEENVKTEKAKVECLAGMNRLVQSGSDSNRCLGLNVKGNSISGRKNDYSGKHQDKETRGISIDMDKCSQVNDDGKINENRGKTDEQVEKGSSPKIPLEIKGENEGKVEEEDEGHIGINQKNQSLNGQTVTKGIGGTYIESELDGATASQDRGFVPHDHERYNGYPGSNYVGYSKSHPIIAQNQRDTLANVATDETYLKSDQPSPIGDKGGLGNTNSSYQNKDESEYFNSTAHIHADGLSQNVLIVKGDNGDQDDDGQSFGNEKHTLETDQMKFEDHTQWPAKEKRFVSTSQPETEPANTEQKHGKILNGDEETKSEFVSNAWHDTEGHKENDSESTAVQAGIGDDIDFEKMENENSEYNSANSTDQPPPDVDLIRFDTPDQFPLNSIVASNESIQNVNQRSDMADQKDSEVDTLLNHHTDKVNNKKDTSLEVAVSRESILDEKATIAEDIRDRFSAMENANESVRRGRSSLEQRDFELLLLRGENDKLKTENTKVKEEKQNLMNELDGKSKELKSLQENENLIMCTSWSIRLEAEKVRKEKEAQAEIITDLETQLRKAMTQIQSTNLGMLRAIDEKAQLQKLFQQREEEFVSKNTALEDTLGQQKAELQRQTQEFRQLQREKQDCEEEYTRIMLEVKAKDEESQSILWNAAQRIDKLEAVVQDRDRELQALNKCKEALIADVESMKQEHVRIEERERGKEKQMEELKTKSTALEETIEKLTRSNSELTRDNQTFKKQAGELQAKIEELNSNLTRTEKTKVAQKGILEAAAKDIQSKLVQKEDELALITKQLAVAEEPLRQQIRFMEADLEMKNNIIERKESERQTACDARDKAMAEKHAVQMQIHNMTALEIQLRTTEAALSRANDENLNLREQLNGFDVMQRNVEQWWQQYQSAMVDRNNEKADYERCKSMLLRVEGELLQTKNERDNLQERLTVITREMDNLRVQNQDLTVKLQFQVRQIADLSAENRSRREAMENYRKKVDRSKDESLEMERSLHKAERENDGLKRDLAESQKEIMSLSDQLGQLTRPGENVQDGDVNPQRQNISDPTMGFTLATENQAVPSFFSFGTPTVTIQHPPTDPSPIQGTPSGRPGHATSTPKARFTRK